MDHSDLSLQQLFIYVGMALRSYLTGQDFDAYTEYDTMLGEEIRMQILYGKPQSIVHRNYSDASYQSLKGIKHASFVMIAAYMLYACPNSK